MQTLGQYVHGYWPLLFNWRAQCLNLNVVDRIYNRPESKEHTQVDLLQEIWNDIRGKGLSKEKFLHYQHCTVAPGWTIREIVDLSIDMGNLYWDANENKLKTTPIA